MLDDLSTFDRREAATGGPFRPGVGVVKNVNAVTFYDPTPYAAEKRTDS